MMRLFRIIIPTALLLLCATISVTAKDNAIGSGSGDTEDSIRTALVDSLFRSIGDSLTWQQELEYARSLDFDIPEQETEMAIQDNQTETHGKRLTWKEKDSIAVAKIESEASEWEPNPRAATFLALVIPGGGQIYNRKYWKLPIVYGGFVGCIYALTWNQSTYSDYMNAYVDIMDNDPNTKSYEDFLPPHYEIDTSMESWLKDVFRNRKNKYRRYRDLSIFAFAGMYVISAIDAYVDAELSHFDISPNLSLNLHPQIMIDRYGQANTGFSLALNF